MITAHLQSGVIEKKMTTLEIKGITRLGCESTSTVPKTGRDLQPQLSHIAIPAFSETTAVSNSFGSFSFTKEEEPSQSPKTLVVHKTAEKNQHMPQSEVLNVANQPTQAIEKDTTQRISTSNNGVSTLAKLKSRVSTKLRSLTVNPFKGSLNKVTQKIHSLTTTVSQASSALSDKMSNTWNSLYQRIAGKKKKDPRTIMSGREVLAKIFVDDRWIMADVEEETEKTNQAIADQHFSENNYLMALKHYNLALQETKDNAQLLVKRSETFIELQQLDLALTDLQQAMENATGREKQKISRLVAKLTYTRGIAAFTEGNLELAEKDLVEAIKLQPKIDKKLKYRSKLYAAMRAAK
jgi:hypothetical protein